ncbi:hypothetical protein [Hyphomonas atlantica]|nr:hypothetical protein [Hyphomonas atlantica]
MRAAGCDRNSGGQGVYGPVDDTIVACRQMLRYGVGRGAGVRLEEEMR